MQGRDDAPEQCDSALVELASCAPAPPPGGNDPELDAKKITWLVDQAIELERKETARQQIEIYFSQRGSPMQGTGAAFVANGERTSIPPALSVGIAFAESTCGERTYNSFTDACPGESYNAWGMIGVDYRSGFGSWEAGIAANFDYLVKHFGCPQSMYDCPGYCVGNTTMQTVDDVQRYIEGIDP